MFQFRRFPAYTYFIQCTLQEYCSCGFPHSEIHGSMRMCRSPWLIAACHVLLRLLMPRHSPCALYSLTYVGRSSLHSVFAASLTACAKNFISAPSFLLTEPDPLRWAPLRKFRRSFLLPSFSVVKKYSCSRIMQAFISGSLKL